MKQGAIVIIPVPFSDFSRSKRRPALVVSNNSFNESEDIIAVAISGGSSSKYAFRIDKNDFVFGNLEKESFIHAHKVVRIHKSLVSKVIGSLQPNIVAKTTDTIGQYLSV